MKILGKRMRFLKWLRSDIFKVAVGTIAPKPLQIIYNILFPVLSTYNKQNDLRYDAGRNVYFVNGVEFSGEFFGIMKNAAKDGAKFQLSFDEGVVTLRELGKVFEVKTGKNGDN